MTEKRDDESEKKLPPEKTKAQGQEPTYEEMRQIARSLQSRGVLGGQMNGRGFLGLQVDPSRIGRGRTKK